MSLAEAVLESRTTGVAFPDLQWIASLADSPYEREFLEAEYGMGLDYYLARLDRILFSGKVALDAGGGAGQWSIALAQRFRHVQAVDLNSGRLSVLRRVAAEMGTRNVTPAVGSIERLPCPDASVDAVFCYSVIMSTDVEKALNEFHRVLRPGGRVYICLNADGWSRYLDEERGKSDENVRQAARRTLYTTYWKRALERGLADAQTLSVHEHSGGLKVSKDWTAQNDPSGPVSQVPQLASGVESVDPKRIAAWNYLLCRYDVCRELLPLVYERCGQDFLPLLLDDAWALLDGQSIACRFGPTRAYQPVEFEAIVRRAGFTEFQWAEEGRLACDWRPQAEPRYAGRYRDELAVWECVCVKPGRRLAVVSLERHLRAATDAWQNPVYIESVPNPVLSNAGESTYPAELLEYARSCGKGLGGEAYMRELARELTRGTDDEEQVIRQILRFVQQTIFRDPVAQPIAEDGSIPDGLVCLLCARGRCGHTTRVLVELFRHAGLEARTTQLPNHVIAEVKCLDRWVIADADAFKNGVIPVDREGRLLSMEQIRENPYQLDRFPATGWMIRPDSCFTRGVAGFRIRGYVDALEPEERGFVSGYYVSEARGFPPSLPSIGRFEIRGNRFVLQWEPSSAGEGRLLGYRVQIAPRPRGWSYDTLVLNDAIRRPVTDGVLELETTNTRVEGDVPAGSNALFASVTAISDRIEKEPETHFWPSEEVHCNVPTTS